MIPDLSSLDLSTLVFNTLMGVAAVWDWSSRRIPNGLVVSGLLLAIGFQAQAGGLAGLGSAFLGIGAAFGALFGLFALRVMGGGDVKLAMVIGGFLGWKAGLLVIACGTVIHGGLALGMLLFRRFQMLTGRASTERPTVPHAIGFALAAWAWTAGYLPSLFSRL
jgi:Flp pilus assembly protein protease CpaA